MMLFQALAVGFAFVSFMQDSFEAGKFSVHASDLKAAGRLRSICESLCRSKREDGPHFRQELSLEVCLRECIRSKRAVESSSVEVMGQSSRSRRNTNQQDYSDDCVNPPEYVPYPPGKPYSIKVDYSIKKPNLSITWSPVRRNPYYNWSSYALHYFGGERKGRSSINGFCKLVPKEQTELILENGDGWDYPDYIWVAVVTYPHGKFDEFDMKEFGPTPRPPPTLPTKSNDSPTKLIVAIIGAVCGAFLLLVFVFLIYRKQINITSICKRGSEQRNVFVHPRINNPCVPLTGDVDNHCTVSPKINNDLQFPAPTNNTTGPDTFYACYFSESQWFQVQVASVVNYFRQNGYAVEMDVMNSSERIDLGPTRWAEQQIKKARNVLVFLSPGLLRMCGGDGEETDSSHQEHDRLWYELDLLRKVYAQTHSARKMVCIILPNMSIDPADLPLWAEMRYKWPEDEINILKRLNDRPIIQPW